VTELSYSELRSLYREDSTIAVVGASVTELKPGHFVPSYLQGQGLRIVPVNPRHEEVLGERCYPSLRDVAFQVDVVEVFRPADEAPAIAEDAVAIGARCLWLQVGIISEEAAEIAEAHGLAVVMDRCMGVMHGELGLGPGVVPPVAPAAG
jgi:predicted CoA-binding protein